VLLTVPLITLQLGPGANEGIPRDLPSIRGLDVLTAAVGAGATSPTDIVIDTKKVGGADAPAVRAALARLERGLTADPHVAAANFERTRQYVDTTGRYMNVQVIGESDYGKPASLDFVTRLRNDIIPAAGFPEGTAVFAGGGPPGGKDFLDLTYSWFPYLIL